MTDNLENNETATAEVNNLEAPKEPEKQITETDFNSILDKYRHENGKLLGKFDNEDKLVDAYKNAEKELTKMKMGIEKAPETYDIKIKEELADKFQLDMEDPRMKKALEHFQLQGFSNEKANDLVNLYAELELSKLPDLNAEREKLGADANVILNDISLFMNKLDPEEQTILDSMTMTAEGTKLVHKLISLQKQENIPAQANGMTKSKAEWYEEAQAYRDKCGEEIRYNQSMQDKYLELMNKSI